MTNVDTARRDFLEQVEARSIAGGIEYGERSFEAAGENLCDEIAEEVADIASWGIPLYARVQRLRAVLAKAEAFEAFAADLRDMLGPNDSRVFVQGTAGVVLERAQTFLKEIGR